MELLHLLCDTILLQAVYRWISINNHFFKIARKMNRPRGDVLK